MKGGVGLFGGTFNPVHWGHLRAAEEVAERLELERVLFVPSASPPHKPGAGVAPASRRLAWVRDAVADNPRFAVDPLEVERGGRSYSVDTLREIGAKLAPERPVFVIGCDAFAEIDAWREPEQLFALAHFAVMTRPRTDGSTLRDWLPGRAGGRRRARLGRFLRAAPRLGRRTHARGHLGPRRVVFGRAAPAARGALRALPPPRDDPSRRRGKWDLHRGMSESSAIDRALVAAAAGVDRKADDPVVLDVRDVVSFADAFVFLTGRSDRQVRAIAEAIERTMKQHGDRPLGVEGLDEGRWVLIDLNDVIVHVFQPEVREHYDLERLWSDAPRVPVPPAPAPAPAGAEHEAGSSHGAAATPLRSRGAMHCGHWMRCWSWPCPASAPAARGPMRESRRGAPRATPVSPGCASRSCRRPRSPPASRPSRSGARSPTGSTASSTRRPAWRASRWRAVPRIRYPAGLLAGHLCRQLDLRLDAACLLRTRDTPTQTGLSRTARRRNVRGARDQGLNEEMGRQERALPQVACARLSE